MNEEQIANIMQGVFLAVLGFWLIWFVARWIVIEVRNHRNQRAAVQTSRAVVYCKHPDVVVVPQGRASSNVHYITFHTDSGDAPKLYMGPRDFYAIQEGAKGQLTWQGERFWKFVPES